MNQLIVDRKSLIDSAASIAGDHSITNLDQLGGVPFKLADDRIVPLIEGPAATSVAQMRTHPAVKNPMAAWDGNPNTYADEKEASWGGCNWIFPSRAIIRRLTADVGGGGGQSYGSISGLGTVGVPAGQRKTFEAEFREVTRGTSGGLSWAEPTGSRGVVYEISYSIQGGQFTDDTIAIGDIVRIDIEHDELPLEAYIVQQISPHWILAPLEGAPLIYTSDGAKPSPQISFNSINVAYLELTARLEAIESGGHTINSAEPPNYAIESWKVWIQRTDTEVRIYDRLGEFQAIETFTATLEG